MSNRRHPANAKAAAYPLDRGYAPSTTSGCARRRRKAIERRTHTEDMAFYLFGRIPASARSFALCPCGARAFSRDEDDHLDDFNDAHAYCEDVFA